MSPDITSEPYARRVSLPVAQQVANEVITPGPHLADADTLQKMIDAQQKHNYNVYMANKESLDQGQSFLRYLKMEGLINAEPKTEAELLLSNMDFVPPNDAERILGHALFLCPNECRQVWFKLRQLSATTRKEGATLQPLSPESNRQRVCNRHCRQIKCGSKWLP